MSRGGQADGQDLRLQPGALTGATWHAAGILQQAILLGLRIGSFQLAVNKPGSAFKWGGPITLAPVTVLISNLDFLIGAIDQRVALFLG